MSDPLEQKNEGYWWKEKAADRPGGGVHSILSGLSKRLQSQQNARQLENWRHIRLYGDQALLALTPLGFSRAAVAPTEGGGQPVRERLTLNVVRMAIDTLASKIAKNRPKPTFVTEGGDYNQQQRAKGLDKFVQGIFYMVGHAAKALQVFIDGCVTDLGVLHWFRIGSKIHCERILPGELYVDEVDGMYGAPRQLLRIKAVQREVLLEQFPEFEKQIKSARSPNILAAAAGQRLADMVEVTEAWHLPTGVVATSDEPEDGEESTPDALGGRHVICLDNVDLLDEPWTRDDFPFTFFRWSKRLVGFYGQGVAEQLAGDQLAINKILKTIGQILHLMSSARWLVEESSDVVEAHLNNAIGPVLKYSRIAPQIMATNTVPTELFQELEARKGRAFERIGVSQLSVAAKKPAGLNAGVALNTYNDIESERFVLVGQAWEQFHLDCAKQIVALGEEISKDPEHAKDFDVAVTSKGGVERIRWEDVHLERDSYVMKMMPTSSLPTTPAAKQQAVMDWQQAGWIDPTEARSLLDFPDLEASSDLASAARDDIHWTAQQMLDSDEFITPEPLQDLQYGMKHMAATYLRARRLKVSETRLSNLRTWIDTAQQMMAPPPSAAPAGAPPAPAGAPGPAAPAAPPPGAPMPQAA